MGKLTDEQKIECVEKYKTGNYTCTSLCKEYDIKVSSMSNMLKKRGVIISNDQSKLQRKYTLNENYFDLINTENKAYFLGLMYADGCNFELTNCISIKLQDNDKEILEKFNIEIQSNRPLSIVKYNNKNKNWKNQYKLTINSKYMSKQLALLGCFKAKSLTLNFPTEEQVPNHLIQHFIRGYFDGDGCTNTFFIKQKQYIRVSITSTENFLIKFKNIINEININGSISKDARAIKNNSPTRTIYIGGNLQTIKFLDWLYKDSTIYLQRKYDKYKSYVLDNTSKN